MSGAALAAAPLADDEAAAMGASTLLTARGLDEVMFGWSLLVGVVSGEVFWLVVDAMAGVETVSGIVGGGGEARLLSPG